MRRSTLLLTLALFLSVVLVSSSPSLAGQSSGQTAPVTIVVTALGPNYSAPPAISKEDVAVYSRKNREDIVSWVPAQGDKAGLQLAILIDDADSATAIGPHLQEIKDFITSQPSTTQVGLFYATHGSAQAAADFSADHAAVVKKLRLPLGRM